jgi:predicted transcriptional regulator
MADNFNRFIDSYNDIDAFLRRELGVDQGPGFAEVVRRFGEKRPRFEGAKELRLFAELRNLAVHGQKLMLPVFEPSDAAVAQVEAIRDRLISPPVVGVAFARKVQTVGPNSRLSEVLALVRQHDFSQFPVYADDVFCGLVTENGLTRWLANHVDANDSLIDLGDHEVSEVLTHEEERQSARIVARMTPLDVVEAMFADSQILEAVIGTQNGRPKERPLGIVTRWDVAGSDLMKI